MTPVSHATIFTGTYPQFHTVTDFGHPLPTLLPYLPEILQKSGYHTAAFIGSLILDPKASMAPGFDRGFDFFDAGFRPKLSPDEEPIRHGRAPGRRCGRPRHHLAQTKNRQSPFFIWVHLYDPHAPYDPPAPYDKRFTDPYDGEVAYADASLGKLFTYLRQRGLYDRALIVMMSDHGESLGAHGESMHGIFLYDETIRVPLLFKLPGELLARRRVPTRVRLVDVAPTLLSMLSLPLPPTFQGESLVPLMKGDAGKATAARSPCLRRNRLPAPGFWMERDPLPAHWKISLCPRSQARTLRPDAGSKLRPTTSQQLLPPSPERCRRRLDRVPRSDQPAITKSRRQPAPISAEQSENLAALGYVASSSGGTSQDPFQGADPKDKIGISNISARRNDCHRRRPIRRGNPFTAARARRQSAHHCGPDCSWACALAKVQRYPEAIAALRKAIELMPDSVQAQYELGLALYRNRCLAGFGSLLRICRQEASQMARCAIFPGFGLRAHPARARSGGTVADRTSTQPAALPRQLAAGPDSHARSTGPTEALPYLKEAASIRARQLRTSRFPRRRPRGTGRRRQRKS